MRKRILSASGQKKIDDALRTFEAYEVVQTIEYRNEIIEACLNYKPDILLVTEGLSGTESLYEILIQLVKDYPNIRVVYLAGHVDKRDTARVDSLGLLVMTGIYDVIQGKELNAQTLKQILDNPKKQEEVEYLTRNIKKNSATHESQIYFDIPEETTSEDTGVVKNLVVISSIKPGTGKSFLSTNVAAAIAKYGVPNKEGQKPRVALIEADLQNLSIGTILGFEDTKENLKSVMNKIGTVISDKDITGTKEEMDAVNEYIKGCFKPYVKCKNLEALVGSQLRLNEVEDIEPYYYVYLITEMERNYDVIIVDTNSSLTHVTTYPLLQMAKECYYILNLDFNNVRNNSRYKDILTEMGISHKVKYVLNEDISDPADMISNGGAYEEIMFTANHLQDSGFKLEARIPLIPKTIFLNRLYQGTPIVLDNDKNTLRAKYEILKVANQIWAIENLKEIEDELNAIKNKKKKSFFGGK